MSAHSTSSPSTCPDCGGPKYRYAKFCGACKSKGERNPRFGKKFSEATREKMRQAALARIQKPRKKKSSTKQAGRDFARRWFAMPELCERCGKKRPHDRHHIDDNPQNNDPANIAFLCRKCHQDVDGRTEWLRRRCEALKAATHCKNGHPYDEPNTKIGANGRRVCRTCARAAQKRYDANRRKK